MQQSFLVLCQSLGEMLEEREEALASQDSKSIENVVYCFY